MQHHDACYVVVAVGKKARLGTKALSSSEEIKPVALFIVELCLVKGPLVSQSVGKKFIMTFLDFAMPKQYCQTVVKRLAFG